MTSCLKTKPEMPATSSAKKTRVRNMAYCETEEHRDQNMSTIIILPFNCEKHQVHCTTDLRYNNCKLPKLPFNRTAMLQTLLVHIYNDSVNFKLTSFSIHGLPRQVAKQPNRPKMTMTAPVPIRTYGALVLVSEASKR